MEEKSLLKLWNAKRMQMIVSQIAPALVLIVVLVLAAQGTFADASDSARYLAIAVAAITGLLAILTQTAIIREAGAIVADLGKVQNGSDLTKKIASSQSFLTLTAVGVIGLGLVTFALVVWSVMA
jgi:hypothetical protein